MHFLAQKAALLRLQPNFRPCNPSLVVLQASSNPERAVTAGAPAPCDEPLPSMQLSAAVTLVLHIDADFADSPHTCGHRPGRHLEA